MQYTYHYPRRSGKWTHTLFMLAQQWRNGVETTLYAGDVYHLWSPVSQEEFPY